MDNALVAGLAEKIAGTKNTKLNELMKNHTSFKVGGPADILVTPESAEQIIEIVKLCHEKNIPLFVMGNGTNLVVSDKGIRGLVLKIFDKFNSIEVNGNSIIVQAGALLSTVSNIALEHQLSGLEFASGIPGTLGGAIAMNAGAYGGEMKDVAVRTRYIDCKGHVKVVEGEQHRFEYRRSIIQKEGGIVLNSELQLKKGTGSEIKAVIDDLTMRRKEKQPLEMPSAGSIFKRPEGYYTGKLIEECGLKGYRIGGAEVSAKHCGFIVNAGGASASDIKELIRYIQDTVKARYGVELQTEVKIVGEE